MIKKEIFTGILAGLFSNLLGIVLYILIFSDQPLGRTISDSIEKDFMGVLITAGALLNFLPFFLFLKKDQVYRARGVLLVTILAALTMAILKIL